MVKALRINVHPRTIQVARMLHRGEREFSELHPRDKELLLQCDMNLDGLVTEEEVKNYMIKKRLEEKEGDDEEQSIINKLQEQIANATTKIQLR